MEASVSETEVMVRQMVKDFALRHIAPHRDKWDEEEHFPITLFKEMGKLGLMGIIIPEAYGGVGLSYSEYAAAISELAKYDGGIALSVAAHTSLCTNHIFTFGNERQKSTWVSKLAIGEYLGAWALTEPNTGSDAGNMRTRAVKKGNDWVLNGTKNFITHGKSADLAVVIARTGEKNDKRNTTAFVIERGTSGFSAGKKESKLGMRSSETAEIILDNCIIPNENLLGTVGEGFVQSMQILEGGRISIAALSLGLAQGAFAHAVKYAKQRRQFNRAIASFQGISFKLATMATEIAAAELLVKQAATFKNEKKSANKVAAMAKYYASEVCVRVANEAIQIFGGYGFIKDYPVEKYYRDAKLCTIGEGTSEIQKLVIARSILKD